MSNPSKARDGCLIGVDTGGTFTDVTLLDPATGRLWTAKTSSTPDDPSRGFGIGIAEALKASGLRAADVGRVLHGTTVATNLILEGKGAKTALITTDGLQVRARDRAPGRTTPCQLVRLGEAETSGAAGVDFRGRRPLANPTAASSSPSTRPPCTPRRAR